jgi:hypothetical protein
VNTGLKPGYYDKDELMFHACFNLLKDYVECELAWMECIFDDEAGKKYGYPSKLSRFFGGGRHWRSKEAGLAHLDWEINMEPDQWGNNMVEQKESAKEQLALYKWWTEVRPSRPDPYEDYEHKNALGLTNECWETEEAYDKEDDEMLNRLLKIRRHLWT